MSRYLSAADLIRINQGMIIRWGGSAGVRDQALLESAVNRPQTGYYGGVFEEAAALCESLVKSKDDANVVRRNFPTLLLRSLTVAVPCSTLTKQNRAREQAGME